MDIVTIVTTGIAVITSVWGLVQKVKQKNLVGAYDDVDDVLTAIIAAIESSGRAGKNVNDLKKVIQSVILEINQDDSLHERVKQLQNIVDNLSEKSAYYKSDVVKRATEAARIAKQEKAK